MSAEILKDFNPRPCIASKIMKAHRIINSVFRKHLKQFDLSNSQMSILFMLSKMGITKQHELASNLSLEKSSLSRNLKRLFENGTIDKNDDLSIEITEKGLNLVVAIIPYWEKSMEEAREMLGSEGEDALNIIIDSLK